MKPTDITRLRKRRREAARAPQELEKRLFHLKTLYDVSREIGSLMDRQAIMKNLVMMVIGTFGTFRGLILLVDTERASIEAVAPRGRGVVPERGPPRGGAPGLPGPPGLDSLHDQRSSQGRHRAGREDDGRAVHAGRPGAPLHRGQSGPPWAPQTPPPPAGGGPPPTPPPPPP